MMILDALLLLSGIAIGLMCGLLIDCVWHVLWRERKIGSRRAYLKRGA